MADGDEQTDSLRAVIEQCPDLKIAIGHFGMEGLKPLPEIANML